MRGTSLSVDPKQAGRKPPYTARKQRPPGLESKMVPKAMAMSGTQGLPAKWQLSLAETAV
jgi:hypothetical protein